MKDKVNAYLAVLLITVIGGGATLLIIHIVNSDTFIVKMGYTSLQ